MRLERFLKKSSLDIGSYLRPNNDCPYDGQQRSELLCMIVSPSAGIQVNGFAIIGYGHSGMDILYCLLCIYMRIYVLM